MLAGDLATLPLPRHQRARGDGRIVTLVRDGGTHLSELYQEGCAKIRLPHTHDLSLQAVLINTTGGLTGGDDVRWSAIAAPDARLTLTTQACERVYRTNGPAARLSTSLTVGAGAHLDWLPQETILFEDSWLERQLDVDLAPDASFTAVEPVLLGRTAMLEDARRARLTDRWRIRRGGRLIHAEAGRLDGAALARDGISTLAGARAFATLLHIGPRAAQLAEHVRRLLPPEAPAGLSVIGDRLVVRVLADSGLALRRLIVPILGVLSGVGTLPRMWSI